MELKYLLKNNDFQFLNGLDHQHEVIPSRSGKMMIIRKSSGSVEIVKMNGSFNESSRVHGRNTAQNRNKALTAQSYHLGTTTRAERFRSFPRIPRARREAREHYSCSMKI